LLQLRDRWMKGAHRWKIHLVLRQAFAWPKVGSKHVD